MSKKIKGEQKKFLGETLNQYDKALNEGIAQLDKKNREQNHKISSLVNSFDNEFLEKDVEGNMTTLENSKDGMVIINEIQGSTEVNYCKDGEKELILNGDIDTQGKSFVTITEGVDGGLVDVSLEGNTEINLSKTKDPVLVTREFDDINCNIGKLQYTIDDVTTINDEPGKVDIDRIVGDTMVNHAVNGSEELILNAHINESGDNNITLNGVTSDGGKVDVVLEGNTLVNVSNVKDDYITPTIEDKVDQGSVISLPEVSEGLIHIDEIEGNTLVNYCTDGAKELTLNGGIDVEGNFITVTEGVDNGLVDVICEGNTLVNLKLNSGEYCNVAWSTSNSSEFFTLDENSCCHLKGEIVEASNVLALNWCYASLGKFKIELLKPNTTYTIILNNSYDWIENFFLMEGNSSNGHQKASRKISKNIYTVTTRDSFEGLDASRVILYARIEGDYKGKVDCNIVAMLEGDWTDKEIPTEYFEGMKSVGQDDENGHKIEILSRNKNEINLPSYTYSFTNEKYGRYYLSFPMMGKTFSYRYDYEIISISEEQDSFYTNLAGSSYTNPNLVDLDFHIGVVNQRLYNGAKGTVVVDNVSADSGYILREIRCIRTLTPVTITYKITNFALYFSDNADTYIPYAENKKEILLNEPLRSLPNGVKDRFVKIGGKWFIERNCMKITFDGSESIWSATGYGGHETRNTFEIYMYPKIHNKPGVLKSICDTVIVEETESIPINDNAYRIVNDIGLNDGTYFLFTPSTSIVPYRDIDAWREWLSKNPITIIVECNPIYEPLEIEPTLNTYNDTTHISNNSIIPCNMQIKNTGYNCILKPSTLYTVAVDTNKSGTIGINLGGAEVTTTNNVATITTPETLIDDSLRIYGKGIKASKVRLLEGDKTNWIPSYFEGMKSSFEDKIQDDGSYQMKIVSNNKNLWGVNDRTVQRDNNSLVVEFDNATQIITINGVYNKDDLYIYQGREYIIKDIPKNELNYTLSYEIVSGSYDITNSVRNSFGYIGISSREFGTTINIGGLNMISGNSVSFKMKNQPNNTWFRLDKGTVFNNLKLRILLEPNSIKTNYVESKSNKIQLSSIEPLRGVNGIHDRLVFKDGKLMIERRCKGVVLDGSDDEGWFEHEGYSTKNTLCLSSTHTIFPEIRFINMYSNYEILCDKFNATCYFNIFSAKTDEESIGFNGDNLRSIFIKINKSKLSTQDVAGFKQWLSENPLTVVYVLKEPTYEEIEYDLQKIILESYTNGTLFIDTNIPPTKVSFNCFEEELTYLYPSTSYTIQFNSDRNTTADITLGGTELLAQNIVIGLNRISITTPSTLVDNKLVINGTGAKISEVVVTDTDREFKYFEGMKSVGECEKLEVVSGNKNLYNFDWTTINTKNDYGTSNGYMGTIQKLKPNTKYYITVKNDNNIDLSLNGYNHVYISGGIYGTIWVVRPGDNIYGNNSGKIITDNTGFVYFRTSYKGLDFLNKLNQLTFQIEEGSTATDYIPHQSNTQQLTHEPLRAVGDVKDKYVLIDGKWYIERKCGKAVLDGTNHTIKQRDTDISTKKRWMVYNDSSIKDVDEYNITIINNKYRSITANTSWLALEDGISQNSVGNSIHIYLERYSDGSNVSKQALISELQQNPVTIVYQLAQPVYEPIDYNPFEVYSDVTHISTNSTIPCNITIKNHGYNLVALKENTQYTLYVDKNTTNALTYRLGDYVEINSLSKFTFTTPSTLTDKTLRIDGKGAKVNDLMLIEGIPTNDSIGYFDGLKSSYECEKVTDENDENYGKYKVDIKVVGKNLISGTTPNSYQNYNTTNNNFSIVTNSKCSVTDFIRVIPGKTYIGTGLNGGGAYYDKNKKPILPMDGDLRKPFTVPTGAYYLIANLWTNPTGEGNIQLEEGNTVTAYEPYFESKQTVYLNSPLLKGDEIVWKDNKIQHYHKMKTIVFDGSDDENWSLASISTQKTNVNVFDCNVADSSIINDAKISAFSDKLPSYSASYLFNTVDIEGMGQPSRRIRICLSKSKASTVEGFKQWLQQNPIKVAYTLATPYYEEISDYPLKLNVIANSSLSTESTIQVTNISFNIYEETLPYLYPNTKYYITFNADVNRNNIIINLGGNHVVFDCKVGFNKVEITTPSDTTNLLTFSGTGVNIDHVKVTQQDIDEYFEGMKSVGECENNTLEIICKNNDNSKSTTQTLTHEPLRAVGDIKDKYVLIDGKWYIERNCGSYTATGNENIYIYPTSNDENVGYFVITDILKSGGSRIICDLDKYTTQAWSGNNAGIGSINVNGNNRIIHSHYDFDKLKAFLQKHPTYVYQLATPTYEPISYNPFTAYSDITHITTNSLIPTNVVVKNHGYNCILKPSTKYTVALNKPNGTISAKLGGSAKVDSTNSIFTITTPSTLSDNALRLSGSGKVKDIMILEGDKTVNTPSYFEGIESVFEQKYDTEKGKYRVTAKVEGNGKESTITFYINEPLRGTDTAKDKVFIQDGKVIVERNCDSITVNGSEKINKSSEDYDSANNITFSISMNNLLSAWLSPNDILCSTLPSIGHYIWNGVTEGITSDTQKILFGISRKRLKTQDINGFKQWLQQNPTTIVYALVKPTYEEADCDLSKLILENYENSSLIFESNIPVSANIRYSGEVPVVTQAKALSSKVDNTTLDINENIIPYMCDIDYRIVELQLMNGDTQGEGIELLGIGDIEILGNENVLFNNREDKKYNYSYDMLKRDILSQRYSKEEYQYRLDRYLLANKISDEEYKELEGLLNNGE